MKTCKRSVKTVSLLSVVCGSLWLPVLISLLWLVLNTPFLKTEATCDDVNPTMMTTTATTTGTYKREVEVVDSILHSIESTSLLIVRFYFFFFFINLHLAPLNLSHVGYRDFKDNRRERSPGVNPYAMHRERAYTAVQFFAFPSD